MPRQYPARNKSIEFPHFHWFVAVLQVLSGVAWCDATSGATCEVRLLRCGCWTVQSDCSVRQSNFAIGKQRCNELWQSRRFIIKLQNTLPWIHGQDICTVALVVMTSAHRLKIFNNNIAPRPLTIQANSTFKQCLTNIWQNKIKSLICLPNLAKKLTQRNNSPRKFWGGRHTTLFLKWAKG